MSALLALSLDWACVCLKAVKTHPWCHSTQGCVVLGRLLAAAMLVLGQASHTKARNAPDESKTLGWGMPHCIWDPKFTVTSFCFSAAAAVCGSLQDHVELARGGDIVLVFHGSPPRRGWPWICIPDGPCRSRPTWGDRSSKEKRNDLKWQPVATSTSYYQISFCKNCCVAWQKRVQAQIPASCVYTKDLRSLWLRRNARSNLWDAL